MTNLVLYFVIAAFITILAARYALPIFFKVVAIPGQIVQIVNGVLVAIIFVLSFVGLYYVFNDSVPVPPQPVVDLTPIKKEKNQKKIKESFEPIKPSGSFTNAITSDLPCTSDAPVELVRSYYDDLDRQDANSAVEKWLKPKSDLRAQVNKKESAMIKDIKLKTKDCKNAIVSVDVIVKNRNEGSEKWDVDIYLQMIDGQWKISKMKGSQKK